MKPATITTPQLPATNSAEFGEWIGEYRYVTDALAARQALAWVLEAAEESPLSTGPVVGIDIETTSLLPREGMVRLCQVAAGDRCVVLDCFAFDAWSALAAATDDRDVQWIAHNAEFEQSWLGRHAGRTLAPMFDTRWVFVRERARRTGEFSPRGSNLAHVCDVLLNFELSKTERLSDWTTPVLSEAQVEYAALDALVLIPLRDRLEREAIENGWTAEVEAAAQRSADEALRFLDRRNAA
jgi:ribonuclease D